MNGHPIHAAARGLVTAMRTHAHAPCGGDAMVLGGQIPTLGTCIQRVRSRMKYCRAVETPSIPDRALPIAHVCDFVPHGGRLLNPTRSLDKDRLMNCCHDIWLCLVRKSLAVTSRTAPVFFKDPTRTSGTPSYRCPCCARMAIMYIIPLLAM